jgi:DNA-binding MarR family transcriptional regulator
VEPQHAPAAEPDPGPEGEHAPAAAAWKALRDLMETMRADFLGAVAGIALTPGEGRALAVLDPERPEPMRALATTLCCAASNVTWLVDRLEGRGYVERQAFPADRRVKAVALTAAGVEVRDRLRRAHETPPPALLRLSPDELRTLTRLLAKATEPLPADGNTAVRPPVASDR